MHVGVPAEVKNNEFRVAMTPAGVHALVGRGHRVDILRRAIAPLAADLTPAQQDRVAQALSLVYGTEVFLVLKDIWKLDLPEVTDVVRWTANAIITQALAEGRTAKK